MDRFEGILKVTAVVLYGSMILASLEVSGSGVRKYNGVAYEEGIRFSQESYMDEGHALEWGMWETGDSGVKEARSKVIDFVVHTLTPWLVRFEQAIVKDLLLPDEQDIYFPKSNVDGLMRGDYQSRMQGYATGISNGWTVICAACLCYDRLRDRRYVCDCRP